MPGVKDSEYKCSLSAETLEKAKRELNEDPNTRLIEVKLLRQRLERVPGLQPRTDVHFLLRFLRARKFNQEKAFQSVIDHYQAKKKYPDVFDDVKPSRIKHMIDDGIVEVLAESSDNNCRVVIFRGGKWDPARYPMEDFMKMFYVLLMHLSEDEEAQVHGFHMIDNMEGIQWKHVSQFTPSLAKKFNDISMDAVPIRMKKYDCTSEPSFFDVIYSMSKPFMKEKMKKRVHLHGTKYDEIHKSIKKEFMPSDLGGCRPLYNYKSWIDVLLGSDSSYEEDNKFGYVNMTLDSDSKAARSEDAAIAGMGGTFKKLDVN